MPRRKQTEDEAPTTMIDGWSWTPLRLVSGPISAAVKANTCSVKKSHVADFAEHLQRAGHPFAASKIPIRFLFSWFTASLDDRPPAKKSAAGTWENAPTIGGLSTAPLSVAVPEASDGRANQPGHRAAPMAEILGRPPQRPWNQLANCSGVYSAQVLRRAPQRACGEEKAPGKEYFDLPEDTIGSKKSDTNEAATRTQWPRRIGEPPLAPSKVWVRAAPQLVQNGGKGNAVQRPVLPLGTNKKAVKLVDSDFISRISPSRFH